jgi:hypothetical protein
MKGPSSRLSSALGGGIHQHQGALPQRGVQGHLLSREVGLALRLIDCGIFGIKSISKRYCIG